MNCVSLWIHFQVCSNKVLSCFGVCELQQKKVSIKFSVLSRSSHGCSQTMAVENKFLTFLLLCVHACVQIPSLGKALRSYPVCLSPLLNMCALGMTVYRRGRVKNSTVIWVVIAVFGTLGRAVAPRTTGHYRPTNKTEGWADPASIQREPEWHQTIFMKDSNGEPNGWHHPTQS